MATINPAGAVSATNVNGWLISAALIVAFAFLTAIGSLIRVPLPFTPVPFTLQTFFALLAGGLLGTQRGVASQVLYLGLGTAGIPVFAAGSLGLLGPTGGYLLGLAIAALIVGRLTSGSRGLSFVWTSGAMAVGVVAIYLLGIMRLSVFVPASTHELVSMGVLPFVVGDVAKLAAAAGIVVAVRRKIRG